MNIVTLEHDRDRPEPVITRPVFLSAMARMASTVCVVNAECAGFCPGRTVTAAFSLTADPPTILVSITRDSALAQTIEASQGFSLAMLGEGQELIADAFAGKVSPESRYLMGIWGWWRSGRPRLFASAVSLDCMLAGAMPIADHMLFAGRVTEADISEGVRPLLWHDRAYARTRR